MDMAIVWVPSACPSPGVLLAQHTAALSFWCCMKQMVLSLACSGLESTLEQLEVGLNEAGNRLQAEDLCLARKDPSLLGAGRVRSGLPLPSSCPKKPTHSYSTPANSFGLEAYFTWSRLGN